VLQRHPIKFTSDGETLAGELVLPEGIGPFPAVLLIGGTISDTRDGDPAASLEGKMPTHGMLRVTADHLASRGIASLRWDKRGVGESTGGGRDTHADVWTDVDDAEKALHALSAVPEVNSERIVVLGESAGGYFASLLAARTDLPAGYILQGALYTDIADMIAFNYGRVAVYCALGQEARQWVEQVAPMAYKMSQHWPELVAAARRGDEEYKAGEGDWAYRVTLRRYHQELEYQPAEQFRHIQKPTLVIQGDKDMNVPPGDCYQVARALKQAGNDQVTLVIVPGADHSMQMAPADIESRIRERISFESFKRPYSDIFLNSLSEWIHQTI
jgi:dipeptidyl aminopeptidase/acylaminoacyl peptidase